MSNWNKEHYYIVYDNEEIPAYKLHVKGIVCNRFDEPEDWIREAVEQEFHIGTERANMVEKRAMADSWEILRDIANAERIAVIEIFPETKTIKVKK